MDVGTIDGLTSVLHAAARETTGVGGVIDE